MNARNASRDISTMPSSSSPAACDATNRMSLPSATTKAASVDRDLVHDVADDVRDLRGEQPDALLVRALPVAQPLPHPDRAERVHARPAPGAPRESRVTSTLPPPTSMSSAQSARRTRGDRARRSLTAR